MLTGIPRAKQSCVQDLAFQIGVYLEEILHRQISRVSLEEHWHQPPEEGASEDALSFFGRNQFWRT